ncbi:alpha/beta fold hydrolase [Bacillus infantis]|uniref:alpha/beta fold hydrolase n=1 Tax=Bacillus infantis TaxID=324767 RepID=UPI0021559915|nr:alpha/beta fold hydrolase [Bacillus infantis]MCR6612981.1 alpha/beta fold hydrolase [Bacillus infantis]
MENKMLKSAGKLVLAGSLGISGLAAGFPGMVKTVQAQEQQAQADYEKAAAEFVRHAGAEKWEEAYPMLSSQLQKYVTKELLPYFWSGLTAPLGKVQKSEFKRLEEDGVHTKAIFMMTAENGAYELILRMNGEGRIDEFFFDPVMPGVSFTEPDYHHPENYSEKQLVIGEGKFALPGVLTVPKGEGPFPAVVLVHGSGSNDRDEKAYSYKPFRDIAVGLANEGIAVLRYDKRTRVHPLKSSLTPDFSIQEETVEDANLAVERLLAEKEIDHDQIFVLGHSQGGFALPLILENDKLDNIKGAIGVAGPAGKFQDLLLWQMDEAVKRAEKMNAPAEQLQAVKANLALYQEQFTILNNPDYSKDNIPASFKLQNPYWWFDLRDYEPTELAEKQDVPMLLLQGGKDIQVPASELDEWKKALADREDVEYKLYPNMFHMLGDFGGTPDGATEYLTPGNVPQSFILDVAKWIKTGELGADLTDYKDYKENQYWSEAFRWAVGEGIIQGYNHLLKPNAAIKETEYLKVFFRYKLGSAFKDESQSNVYALAKEYKLPVGAKPNAALSRGAAAVLLAKSYAKKDLTTAEAVAWLYKEGIINGYPGKDGKADKTLKSYKPDAAMSRAHLVTMLHRLANK